MPAGTSTSSRPCFWNLVKEPHIPMGNHTPVYVDNVREHLTSPGQWYFDNAKQEVLYYPLEGQEMDGIEAILAVEETLVRHAGVENHGWSGVTFEFGTWLRPMQVSNRFIGPLPLCPGSPWIPWKLGTLVMVATP